MTPEQLDAKLRRMGHPGVDPFSQHLIEEVDAVRYAIRTIDQQAAASDAKDAEIAKLKLIVEDVTKKYAECDPSIAQCFDESDLQQAQAMLALGAFGTFCAEGVALAMASARLKERIDGKKLQAEIARLKEQALVHDTTEEFVSNQNAKLLEEIARLRGEIANYQKATKFCDDCKPKGGEVNCCQRCALIQASGIISSIDYALGEPNEMGVSLYDVDCNDERVVAAVAKLKEQLAAAQRRIAEAWEILENSEFGLDSQYRTVFRIERGPYKQLYKLLAAPEATSGGEGE